MDTESQQLKAASIKQWTADPCDEHRVGRTPGSRTYFEELLRVRQDHAPWMADALGYAETEGLKVLDVGCGQGIDVARYAMSGADVTGIDLTPRHVGLARQHAAAMDLDVTVVEGDAEALPFADDAFDRASSNGVLHHTPDMPAALRQIHRVLKPGGQARILVYNRNSFHYWIHQVLTRGLAQRKLLAERSMGSVLSSGVEFSRSGQRPLVRVYSARQVRNMLRTAGFTAVTTAVRHYAPQDTVVTAALSPRLPWLAQEAVLDRLGRIGGWYVVGTGTKKPGRPSAQGSA